MVDHGKATVSLLDVLPCVGLAGLKLEDPQATVDVRLGFTRAGLPRVTTMSVVRVFGTKAGLN